jgi:hypothetical protein
MVKYVRVTGMTAKLILLDDIYEMRKRKEAELAYYHKELRKLSVKLELVRREIDLTNQIIDMIEHEKVLDVKERVRYKSADQD